MPPVRVKVGEGWYVDDAAGTVDDVAGDDGDHPRRDDRDHGDAHDEHPDAARTSPIARNPDRLSRAVGVEHPHDSTRDLLAYADRSALGAAH